jgi:hypothetical protein
MWNGSIGYMLMNVRIGDRAVVQVKLLELLGEAETDCD